MVYRNRSGVRVVVDPITYTYRVEMFFKFIGDKEHTNILQCGFSHKVEAEQFMRKFCGE
jgi:hypothetical protein